MSRNMQQNMVYHNGCKCYVQKVNLLNVFTDAIVFVNSDYVRYDTNVQLPWEVGCFSLNY